MSGKRSILPLRTTPRYSWEISYEFLRSALWNDGVATYTELEQLVGFYLAVLTAGNVFGYTDPEDHSATAQGFGSGDGTTTQFQLVRARGGFAEPVYLATVTSLTVGGVAKVQGVDFTVGTTGIVTFTVAPGAGQALVWNGTFQWLCRFDDDTVDLSQFMSGLTEAKSVKFSSEINP